ncbi:uncharacterized protein LOC124457074 [Xenia sp. Carnegie-2017]|uniref:uncharacterized protein LOC124457074 n=1 Tax=Xenia sp. Carnegie-2017 TaxID=2897299 RepID=UPI001F041B30|nr:uncharacterized protein LOC124457074 [Xenia sp. Carnegie-2017]
MTECIVESLLSRSFRLRPFSEKREIVEGGRPTPELQGLHTTSKRSATVFSGLSNRIQNDLIVAVKDVMLKAIKDEVMRSPFVAISLDETSDVKTLSQLTTIVRYVHPNGKAVEHFLGFTDVSKDRTAARLKQEVGKTLNEYGCGEKLIAQTYDGASVMSGELSGLQTRVREDYPHALFIHCCGHALNLVIVQAVSSTKECRIFFKTVTGLSSFFNASSNRTYLLDTVVGRRIPTGTAVRWHYQSRLIHAVLETRAKLLEVFEYIIENDDEFDGTTFNEARGYRQVLAAFQFVFCLKIFSEIFGLTDVLYNIIQSKQFDIVRGGSRLKSKPVFDMISKIIELDLKAYFPEVYRLCQLILTMPSTSSSAERSFSSLKRIKTYLRSAQGQERLSALATILIEKEMFVCLQGKPQFYEEGYKGVLRKG